MSSNRPTSRQILEQAAEEAEQDTDAQPCVMPWHNPDNIPPSFEGMLICKGDYTRLMDELQAIPDLVVHAESALATQGGGDGGRSTELSIGVRVEVLDVVAGYVPLKDLQAWEQWIRGERGLPSVDALAPAGSVLSRYRDVVSFLRSNLRWVASIPVEGDELSVIHQFTFGRFVTEWSEARRQDVTRRLVHGAHSAFKLVERAATGERAVTQTRIPCPTYLETIDESCSRRLILPDDDEAPIPCPACGTEWTRPRLLVFGLGADRPPVFWNAEAIAVQLRVSARTVRKYAGKACDGDGARRQGSLYCVQDVTAYHKEQQRRRGPRWTA